MKLQTCIVSGLLAAAATYSFSAEPARSVTSHAGKTVFSIDIPEGWKGSLSECKGCYQAADRLIEMVPISGNPNAAIIVAYYPGKVPIGAQTYIEGLTLDGNVELPRIDGARLWTLFGKVGKKDGKVGTAYLQLSDGTLVVDISGRQYEEGETQLISIIKSFKELTEGK